MNTMSNEIVRANLDVHNKEAKYYDQLHQEIANFYQKYRFQKFLKSIVAKLPDSKPLHVLEIGSGTGFLTLQLLKFGYFVQAVELSPIMVDILASKISLGNFQQNIEIFNSDIDSFLDNKLHRDKYHLICMNSVLHHLPDYSKTVEKLLHRIAYQGILFIAHEPLQSSSNNKLYRTLHRIDMKIWSSLLPNKLKEMTEDIDYSLSDLHAEQGISPDALVRIAEDKEFECFILEKYSAQLKSGFLSWIANNISLGKDHFRLAFQNSKFQ